MSRGSKLSGNYFPIAAGITLFVLAVTAITQVMAIPKPMIDDGVGPRLFPAATALFLLVLAMGFTQAAYKGNCPDVIDDPEQAPLPGGLARGAWLLGGLAAMLVILNFFGIGAAGIAAFLLFARAFGSHNTLQDLVVAVLLTLAIWLLFDRALGVQLGPFIKFG